MTRPTGGRDWKGVVDADAEITSEATPNASVMLLIAADSVVHDAITGAYAQCGHAFDGQSTSQQHDRHFAAMIAPGSVAARAWMVLWGEIVGAEHPSIQIETTSSGGIPSAADDVITVPSAQSGGIAYGDVGGAIQLPIHIFSGDDPETAPGPTSNKNRRIELTNSLAPTVEVIRVRNCGGFGLAVVVPDNDLE